MEFLSKSTAIFHSLNRGKTLHQFSEIPEIHTLKPFVGL